jgi:hypothetical protein
MKCRRRRNESSELLAHFEVVSGEIEKKIIPAIFPKDETPPRIQETHTYPDPPVRDEQL